MRKFKISVDGVSYNVEVEEVGGVVSVIEPVAAPAPVAAAPVAPVVKEAPKAAPAAPKAAPAPKPAVAGGAPVKSPMPGMIVKFLVSNGDQVKRGQAILVLEAMKMENDIVADSDGVVNFAVSQGANVNTGDVLATIA